MRRQPAPYCAHTHSRLPCVLTGTVHSVCEIMGPSRGWSEDFARKVVANGATGDQAFLDAVLDRMVRWGEPLWHAGARVMGRSCSCSVCVNPADPRHPWLIVDVVDPGAV